MESWRYKPHHGGYLNHYQPRNSDELIGIPIVDYGKNSFEPQLYIADVERVIKEDIERGDIDSAKAIMFGQRVAYLSEVEDMLEIWASSPDLSERIKDNIESLCVDSTLKKYGLYMALIAAIKGDQEYAEQILERQTVMEPNELHSLLVGSNLPEAIDFAEYMAESGLNDRRIV